MRRTTPLRILALALACGIVLAPSPGESDDTVLFSTAVAPNVLLMIDNSGSMNHIVWYTAQSAADSGWLGFAGFNPATTYPCSTGHYTVPGETQSTTNLAIPSGRCGISGARTIYVDPGVSPAVATRFDHNYIRFVLSLSTTNFNTLINSSKANGTCAQGLGAPASYLAYRRSRIIAARDITRNVICDVNATGEVRFGLSLFRKAGGSNDPNGGYVLVPVNDYKYDHDSNPATPKVLYSYTLNGANKTHQQHLVDAINSLDGETWTPLGETLFQLYTYFLSRTTSNNVKGVNGTTNFPIYTYLPNETGNGGGNSGAGAPTVPGSPIQYACQKNFIIMVTDGEPTMDDFDNSNSGDNTANGFSSFTNLVGDFNTDNALPEGGVPENFTAQNDLFCSGCESATFLDDIAKFVHERDARTDLTGVQNVDVYTVGFTTAGPANQILQKAATVGGGRFYSSSDPSQLDDAIVDAITDVINKSQSFTAATVPASRTTDGNNFYTSYFLPPPGNSFWEGHLKNYEFTADGRILDSAGACALGDPGAPTTCETGPLLTNAPAFWDAATAMPLPAARTLSVSIAGAPVNFDTGTVAAANLGVTYPPATAYAGSTAAVNGGGTNATRAEYLTDEIVSYVRGCNFGTGAGSIGCTARAIRLADIFHSNPMVVGPPNAAINDATYVQFAADLVHRKKVLYAGSNGGFLHGFNAGVWNASATPVPAYTRGTGAELMGFMPYQVRQNIKNLPIDLPPRDFYYVDGPPQAADAWFYPTATTATKSAKTQWHTVLVGGLRQGGRSYYALDVTNPDGLAGYATYPGYLWEFPCEAASCNSWRQYMGETWSEPIITRIRVKVNSNDNGGQGFERWVAIVGAGYDPKGDPNDSVNYDATLGAATSRAGRGIFVIDLKTGGVLAAKVFDHNTANGDPRLRYAIPSTPAVFDLDADGFADVVYVGDLGGNVWKWVIEPIAEDVINGTGNVQQPAWPFKQWFTAPSGTVGGSTVYKSFFFPPTGATLSGKLWLAFGSGQRNNLKFVDNGTSTVDNNALYAVKDLDPLEKQTTPIPTLNGTSPTLSDINSISSCNDLASTSGYFLTAPDLGEKFVTNSTIFLGYLFTGSFVPNTSTDPCTAGGSAYLYGIRLACGEPGLTDPGSGSPSKKVSVGAGLPNRPRTSLGPVSGGGGGGGGGGGCDNQVLIVTSDGSAFNKGVGCVPASGMKVDSWRELQ